MADNTLRPEHIDLAAMVHASAALHDARDRLAAEPHSDQAVMMAQEAIARHVGALERLTFWATLEHQARLAEQRHALQRMNRDAWALLEQLHPQPDPGSPNPTQHIERPPEAVDRVRAARQSVRDFNTAARSVAN